MDTDDLLREGDCLFNQEKYIDAVIRYDSFLNSGGDPKISVINNLETIANHFLEETGELPDDEILIMLGDLIREHIHSEEGADTAYGLYNCVKDLPEDIETWMAYYGLKDA